MLWSKRKKKVESFFSDSVKSHIELRSTHQNSGDKNSGDRKIPGTVYLIPL